MSNYNISPENILEFNTAGVKVGKKLSDVERNLSATSTELQNAIARVKDQISVLNRRGFLVGDQQQERIRYTLNSLESFITKLTAYELQILKIRDEINSYNKTYKTIIR